MGLCATLYEFCLYDYMISIFCVLYFKCFTDVNFMIIEFVALVLPGLDFYFIVLVSECAAPVQHCSVHFML